MHDVFFSKPLQQNIRRSRHIGDQYNLHSSSPKIVLVTDYNESKLRDSHFSPLFVIVNKITLMYRPGG